MDTAHGLSIIISWRDRHELRFCLPKMLELADRTRGELIVVNFGGSALLLASQLQGHEGRVRVVSVDDSGYFNKSAAQNLGAAHSRFPVFFFCDCDIIVDVGTLAVTCSRVASEPLKFATLSGVRETVCNSRKAKHIQSFGYTLRMRTADGRSLTIVDNEEDATTGLRQAPGLLIVKRQDFMRIGGYNSNLHGWGWEDQDMISRLTLGLGLERIFEGDALHVSHDDDARMRYYPAVASRWESRDRMFRTALANYDRADFQGTFVADVANRNAGPGPSYVEVDAKSRHDILPQPSLSVCMIARDEEAVIERCLNSLQGLGKEICVVDTGSRDSTMEVAQKHGAKVVRFTGCNSEDNRIIDFAAARNVALDLATQEWVLQIDADEVLRSGHREIKEILAKNSVDRLGVCLKHNDAWWISGRIFRRKSAGKYFGRIHEYVECAGTFVSMPQIVIENLENKTGKESASDRNIRLCLLSLKENPRDARMQHYLGNEYRSCGQWKEAIACYQEAITLGNFGIGLFHSHYYLGICRLLLRDFDGAVKAGMAAVQYDPRYAEGHCLIADAFSLAGNLHFAKIWYQNALTCGSPPGGAVFPIQYWAYSDHPKKRLHEIRQAESREEGVAF